ncbi:MAG: formylglycine-generating enzyme family protein, partial [Desulfobulbaceae bacterium]|nr:formylglycine-generating enzyme family protein [Desulfobulbaceae bacterium]
MITSYFLLTPSLLFAWTEPSSGIELVRVDGGCFEMGCGSWTDQCLDNERPLHIVCLEGFWIGKYEVTQRQWVTIMGDNPSHFRHGDDLPVDRVSWINAREFIMRLNKFTDKKFSLPTEAQWEYAARSGGEKERYSGGDMVNELGFHWTNSAKMT